MRWMRPASAGTLASAVALALAAAAPPAGAAQDSPPAVPIVAALEPLATVSPRAADEVEAHLRAWVRALERRDEGRPLEVRDGLVRRVALLEGKGDAREIWADAAARSGASHVAIAALTGLANRYSLEVRLVGASRWNVAYQGLFEARGPTELRAAFERAARAVRAALAEPHPPAPLAQAEAGLEAGALDTARGTEDTPEVAGEGEPAVEGTDTGEVAGEGEPAVEGTGAPEGAPAVSEIRVEGNRRIEADAVRAVVGTRVGGAIDPGRIASDVRRIYELGFFRDVRVAAAPGPDGVVVTFLVEENPIVRQVTVSGNDNLGSDDIKEILTLSVGSTIDYPLLFENSARIEALYEQSGYYLAEVGYSIEPIGEAAVAVNFEVEEGKKLRLVEVDFEGNSYFDDGDLRGEMQTKKWGWLSHVTRFWDKSGLYAEPIFHQDLAAISRKYMDDGFIRVRVGDPEVAYDDDGLRVRVQIEEGEQYSVGQIDVAGDELTDVERLSELVELQPGDVFSRSVLSQDVERLHDYYADQGYYFAKVSPRTRVDSERLAVDTIFDVEKGELFFIDRIDVHGNTRTRDQVVRRELSLTEGGLYSARDLKRSRARVQRLGFFEEVEIEPKQVEEPQQVALDVEVVERPTGSFSFGAGFGSTDGFILNAALRQDNLWGKGWSLNTSLDLGSNNSGGFLAFSNPYVLGTMASFSTSLSITDLAFDDFDRETRGMQFSLGYPLDEGETRVFSTYSFTSREITGQSINATSLVQREEFFDESSSLVSFSARRDTRDDPRFPKEGQVTGFAIEFAGLGGLSSFLRFEGRTTWFFPLHSRFLPLDSTFVVNSRIGYVIPFNDVDDFDLPGCTSADCQNALATADPSRVGALTEIDDDIELALTERYFLGGLGAFQLRGFNQRTLGPRRAILGPVARFDSQNQLFGTLCNDPADVNCNKLGDTDPDDFADLELADVIGGNKMFLLNLELQFPLSEDLGLTGIVFFDAGNAFAENESFDPSDLRFGTGVGAQWFSPFGPLVVYLGMPLDRLEDEDASVFEFSLGGGAF